MDCALTMSFAGEKWSATRTTRSGSAGPVAPMRSICSMVIVPLMSLMSTTSGLITAISPARADPDTACAAYIFSVMVWPIMSP